MDKYIENILTVDNVIYNNIEKREALQDDGLLAQNVLSQMRNFVEAVILKVFSLSHKADFGQEVKKQAIKYIKSKDDLIFLKRLHARLEITDSHLTVEPESALRLIWRYSDDLFTCRDYLKKHFNIDCLQNFDKLPLDDNDSLREYYYKIATELNKYPKEKIKKSPTNRFYIHKKKVFRVDGKKYYELVISQANVKATKFDRTIVFTQIDIPSYYAVHLEFKSSNIEIIGRNMPVKIVVSFKVSIRPCEFDNYFKLLGYGTKITTKDAEYDSLMSYLSDTGRNLTDFLNYDDEEFYNIRNLVCKGIKNTPIFDGIEKIRSYYGKQGYNVLTYLLYGLNNTILRNQHYNFSNKRLSNLYLKYNCIPFDDMPFANNLPEHNTSLYDLYDCIDSSGRECELLYRKIRNNTEINAQLYTPLSELSGFGDVNSLIKKYNSNLYYKHKENGQLILDDGFVFISGYENNSIYIIQELLKMSQQGLKNYTNLVNFWMEQSGYNVDDENKKIILQKLFHQSEVALIYGSAGTGKSMMIKHIANLFRDNKKIYLANTHSAVENLKRNIGVVDNNDYYTIKSFLNNGPVTCDILFVDECSTVSNEDMSKILMQTDFKLLVLVGDIYQIESIKFGNWFYIAKECLPKQCIFELSYVHRSAEPDLLKLWDSVRKLDTKVCDIMELYNFCSSDYESLFTKSEDDEIVLCLNYDGLYGINNVNKFLQDNQKGKKIQIGLEQYSVGDPIIFKENQKYGHWLYNNLKGSILDIQSYDGGFKFIVEVNTVFNSLNLDDAPFVLLESLHDGKSVICIEISNFVNTDDEDRTEDNIIPFQVSYAVSIHKAQGLEYDSVKIIITDTIDELISHNIFYTAITRAKHKLKIYWSKKTENNVLQNMRLIFNKRDAKILIKKMKILS